LAVALFPFPSTHFEFFCVFFGPYPPLNHPLFPLLGFIQTSFPLSTSIQNSFSPPLLALIYPPRHFRLFFLFPPVGKFPWNGGAIRGALSSIIRFLSFSSGIPVLLCFNSRKSFEHYHSLMTFSSGLYLRDVPLVRSQPGPVRFVEAVPSSFLLLSSNRPAPHLFGVSLPDLTRYPPGQGLSLSLSIDRFLSRDPPPLLIALPFSHFCLCSPFPLRCARTLSCVSAMCDQSPPLKRDDSGSVSLYSRAPGYCRFFRRSADLLPTSIPPGIWFGQGTLFDESRFISPPFLAHA